MDNQKPKMPSTKKYFLTPDTIYGNFKTIREVKVQTSKALESRWECLHIPTNTIRLVPAARLVYSSNKVEDPQKTQEYMEDLVKKDIHQQGIRNYLYRTYRSNAEKRGHEFNLSKDQFISIIKQPCFYCGLPPQPTSDSIRKTRGSMREPNFYYNGIDRIDSNGAYDVDNCVPCCSVCNYMKRTLDVNTFYDQIVKIYNHLDLGSTTIESTSIVDGSEQSTSQANGGGNGMPLTDNAEGEDIV